MNVANLPVSLENLEQVDKRFKRWRRTRTRGARIPEELWSLAVAVAREQGLNPTARALRLDYYDLKKRLQGDRGPARTRQAQSATFVELVAPRVAGVGECLLELQNARGTQMRITLNGSHSTQLLQLSSRLWKIA